MDLFWPYRGGRNRAGQSGRSPLSFMPNVKIENSLGFLVARSYFFYCNINITLFFSLFSTRCMLIMLLKVLNGASWTWRGRGTL